MAVTGYVNVDCLIHDTGTGAFKVVDVDSSLAVNGKAAIVRGQATVGGVEVDPSANGYRDATGAEVSLLELSAIVCKGSADLTITAGDVTLFAASGQAAFSSLNSYVGNVSISGDGTYDLVLIGPA